MRGAPSDTELAVPLPKLELDCILLHLAKVGITDWSSLGECGLMFGFIESEDSWRMFVTIVVVVLDVGSLASFLGWGLFLLFNPLEVLLFLLRDHFYS